MNNKKKEYLLKHCAFLTHKDSKSSNLNKIELDLKKLWSNVWKSDQVNCFRLFSMSTILIRNLSTRRMMDGELNLLVFFDLHIIFFPQMNWCKFMFPNYTVLLLKWTSDIFVMRGNMLEMTYLFFLIIYSI